MTAPTGTAAGWLRRLLDGLYAATGVVGALTIVLLAALILVQISTREAELGVVGLDELAAWAVAGSALMPLAHTFRHGTHIRVDLIVAHVSPVNRRRMEIAALALGTAMTGFMAYATIDMVLDSYEFGEMSAGQIVVPLWLPQLPLPVGVSVFALALLDDLVTLLLGGSPSWEQVHESAVERAAEEI